MGAAIQAHGASSYKFTGLGVTSGYEYGSVGNAAPALALTQGEVGLVSVFGTVEAGYRTKDAAIFARAKLEGYFGITGIYAGLQSNTGSDRPADYGFPFGIAFMIPPNEQWLFKLHVGAAVYTKNQANEFQLAFSAFYRVW